MGLETATYIDELVETNPTADDKRKFGDDHLRLIKAVLKSSFPNISGAMTASEAELNQLDGLTLSAYIKTLLVLADEATLRSVAHLAKTGVNDDIDSLALVESSTLVKSANASVNWSVNNTNAGNGAMAEYWAVSDAGTLRLSQRSTAANGYAQLITTAAPGIAYTTVGATSKHIFQVDGGAALFQIEKALITAGIPIEHPTPAYADRSTKSATTAQLPTRTAQTTPLPAASGDFIAAHTLGAVPFKAHLELVCLVAEHGYAVGDVVEATLESDSITSNIPFSVWKSATQVGVAIAPGYRVLIYNKSTGGGVVPTAASWAYRFVIQ